MLSLLFILLSSHVVFSEDYVISVYDSVPAHDLVSVGHRVLRCESIFQGASAVQVTQIANKMRLADGTITTQARGMRTHRRNMEFFDQLTANLLGRVIHDWRSSGHYSEKEIQAVFNTHRNLSHHRLKLISIESVENGVWPGPSLRGLEDESPLVSIPTTQARLFSAIRIYDSSPIPKAYSRLRPGNIPMQSVSDHKEIGERVFAEFNLAQLLNQHDIPRANYTWSLGMGDVSGTQQGALLTLFAQVADLLDLHYNHREFFNLGRRDVIQEEDVDIVFYANEKIVPYYMQTLDLNPLNNANGYPYFVTKNNNRYYFFHLKGSDFIKRFFNLRFHHPLYGENRGFRLEERLHQQLRAGLKAAYDQLDPSDYEVNGFSDFWHHMRVIIPAALQLLEHSTAPHNEPEFYELLARLLRLRRALPPDIFSAELSIEEKNEIMEFTRHLTGNQGDTVAQGLSLFAFLDVFIRDPIQQIINLTLTKSDQ
jgi:hypothetical protein